MYTTDPGIIHNPNNDLATYFPLESPNDSDNILEVGDHMFIDILGPINDYVRAFKTAQGVYELQIRQLQDWQILTFQNDLCVVD